MLTVYTMTGCQPCRMTKKELDRLEIPYEEVDLTTTADAVDKVRALGFQAAPVVVTPSGDAWSGYRPNKIQALQQ